MPTHLFHLLRRHPDPTRHSLIDIRNDICMQPIVDAIATNEPEMLASNLPLANL
jgi:hypothetical protein